MEKRKLIPLCTKILVINFLHLTTTRPDIMLASSLLSRLIHNPSQLHLEAGKRVLRYIKGTISFGIKCNKGNGANYIGYCDHD